MAVMSCDSNIKGLAAVSRFPFTPGLIFSSHLDEARLERILPLQLRLKLPAHLFCQIIHFR